MKTVRVVAALIVKENQVLSTQRGYGEFEGGWEFPGGKIEAGESPQEALKREIKEELNLLISVGNKLLTVEYDYPSFHLSMDCFICFPLQDNFELLEHHQAKWLTENELYSVNWLPADEEIIQKIISSSILS